MRAHTRSSSWSARSVRLVPPRAPAWPAGVGAFMLAPVTFGLVYVEVILFGLVFFFLSG